MSNSGKYSLVKKAAKIDLDSDSGGRCKNYTRSLNNKEMCIF